MDHGGTEIEDAQRDSTEKKANVQLSFTPNRRPNRCSELTIGSNSAPASLALWLRIYTSRVNTGLPTVAFP